MLFMRQFTLRPVILVNFSAAFGSTIGRRSRYNVSTQVQKIKKRFGTQASQAREKNARPELLVGERVMPKIDNIEETPNPNAVKFILKEPVTTGAARSFPNAADAHDDPLATSLFDVGEVVSVFYMDRMITVEKEDLADWDDLLPKLAVPIRAAAAAQGGAAAAAGAGALGGTLGALLSDDPRLVRISGILDERIRPALAGDGGWLEIVGLKDNTLTIQYQGACGSCPSSISGTLMAIEGMLQQEVDPDLEVVTV